MEQLAKNGSILSGEPEAETDFKISSSPLRNVDLSDKKAKKNASPGILYSQKTEPLAQFSLCNPRPTETTSKLLVPGLPS
jgi:hypothetical protein